MLVSIVKCDCGTDVYLGGMKKQCPQCGYIISHDKEEFFAQLQDGTRQPLLRVFKFPPSGLHYFASEYPEIGQVVCLICESGRTFLSVKWSEAKQKVHEMECDSPEHEYNFFAWIQQY